MRDTNCLRLTSGLRRKSRLTSLGRFGPWIAPSGLPDVNAAEMAGRVLHDEARKAADAVGLTCTIAGQPPLKMTDELVGEFWFRTGRSFVEPRAIRTVGLLQFTLYSTRPDDHRKSIVIADS